MNDYYEAECIQCHAVMPHYEFDEHARICPERITIEPLPGEDFDTWVARAKKLKEEMRK